MRTYTDLYYEAWQAGAKPIALVFLSSNKATYCFGKQTPTEAMVGTYDFVYIGDEQVFIEPHEVAIASDNVFDWSARVLTFGDFRQSLSTNNDDIFESFHQKELASYTVILDNVDQYFTKLAGQEEFLGHQCVLYQGFDYPNFAFGDFLSMFTGKVTNFELDTKTCFVRAAQAIETVAPVSPVLEISRWYALVNGGVGDTAASATWDYATMEPIFYEDDSWEFETEFIKDAGSTAEILFQIDNNANSGTRLEIGIDASDYPYFKYSSNVNTGSPAYSTVTADFAMGAGTHRLVVSVDEVSETATISDNHGNSYQASLTIVTAFQPLFEFGTAGAGPGDGEFDTPAGVGVDVYGNIFVTDYELDVVQKFNSAGVYQSYFGSTGTGDGQFDRPIGIAFDAYDNIWVVDRGNDRVQKFNSSGVYQAQFGSSGTGNGQFDRPNGLAITTNDDIWVTDYGNERVQKFNSSGSYLDQFGGYGTGNGQFHGPDGIALDTLNNIWVTDYILDRVQKFDSGGSYLDQFGSEGSEDGDFDGPQGIVVTSDSIWVAGNVNDRIQKFSLTGVYQDKLVDAGAGKVGRIQSPTGIGMGSNGNLVVANFVEQEVQVFGELTTGVFDRRETSPTSTDDLNIAPGFDGTIISASFKNKGDDALLLLKESDAGEDFTDIVDGNDVPVVDGTWEVWGDFNTNTSTQESEEPLSFDSELVLPTSSAYTNPGAYAANVPLPLVYGDMTENSEKGAWVCPLIDSVAFVYCVAGWPILSTGNGNVVTVYVDDVLQVGGYTFSESNDYESQGNIAILDFAVDPAGTVTVKCKGKDDAGTLLTNPIDILEDLLEYAATEIENLDWEKNESSFAQAKAYATAQSYTCAGVIFADNSLNYWILTILKSFMGAYRFDQDGLLYIQLLPTTFTENIFGEINEYDAIQLRAKKDVENICNHVIINYARSSVEVDRRYKQNTLNSYNITSEASDATSIAKYKSERIQSFDFDWTRNTATVEKIRDAILDLYKDARWLVTYVGQDFNFMLPDMHDQIRATLSLVRDSDNESVQNGVYALREKVIDLDKFTTKLIFYSVGIDQTEYEVFIGAHEVYIGTDQVYIGGA